MVTTLPVRQLGTTDMNITRVGFGAWAIGGGGWSYAWGPQDDNESIAAMNHAVERGINWIDTAAVYGLGHSEEVVGRFLRGKGSDQRPFIFTKCGMVWDPKNRMEDPKRTLSSDSIRRECEASLRRLGVDRIDLYQFHWPDDSSGTPVEASWRTMEQLDKEGKVRAIGVSNFDVSLLKKIDPLHHVQSLQPPFSLIRRDVASAEIPWCNANRTGVIVYSPMQSGILTESFSIAKVKQMGDNDWRKKSANFQTPRVEKNIALRDALKPIARRHNTSVSAVAVAWTLVWPGVTGAIVGARSPSQIDGWIDAATLTLTNGDLDEIAAVIDRIGVGTGPTRPPGQRKERSTTESTMEAR
jgi:aryl-alcohol dehydrogenase-like predicted oxidoreductase